MVMECATRGYETEGNEFSYLRQEQRNTSTLEALVKPGDQKAAAATKAAKPQKKESKKAK